MILAISFSTCSWVDPFPEYRDVNLIENRGFDVDSFAPASMDGSDPTFDYVGVSALTADEYGFTNGLPAEFHGTIRRLEAVNLFPNGDFEQSTVGSELAYWDIEPPVPPKEEPDKFEVDGSGVINGKSVEFETSGNEAAVLDLDAHALDTFVEPATYFLSLQFVRSSPDTRITFDYGFEYDDEGDVVSGTYLDNQSWVVTSRENGTPVETLPTPGDDLLNKITVFASSGTGRNHFYVGSPLGSSPQKGHLDNIRLGRLDSLPHVAVSLNRDGTGTELPLIAGTYRVSVYVKSEIDDQVTPGANGANRFRAEQIVLGLNRQRTRITRADAGWSSTEWTQVSATFQLDEAALAEDPAVRVRLTVIHPDNPVVGSVLIAEPRLELVTE